MNDRASTSIRLVPEQAAQLLAIGRMDHLAQPVRTLAWLITRYSESLTTLDVARAVGVTPSSARYWRGEFAKRGMTLFSRHLGAEDSASDGGERVLCVDDLRADGIDNERVRYLDKVVNQLFESLRARHRLGEDSRVMLEVAVSYHDLGPSAVGFDEDGIFFTVLDPLLQGMAADKQRLLATIVRFLPEQVRRRDLMDSGLSRAERHHALVLIALLKIAIALDASRTQQLRVRRIETTKPVAYIAIQGGHSAETVPALESAAQLWTKATGQVVRAFAIDALHPTHAAANSELYHKRPRTNGMRDDDRLDTAARKVLRFQLVQMLKPEVVAFLGDDPEGVHKMRVATRRIRTALSVFETSLGPRSTSRFRKRFRGLARKLGVVRDLDVILMHLDERLGGGGQSELGPFADDLRRQRVDATISLREHLRSDRYASLVIDFEAYTNSDRVTKRRTKWRAGDAAPVHIYEAFAEVAAYASGLSRAGIGELHRLRIALKKLRYTVEFYRDILGDAREEVIVRTKQALERLGPIQDAQRACDIANGFLEWRAGSSAGPPVFAYREARASEIAEQAALFKSEWNDLARTGLRTLLARSLEPH